MNQNAKAKIAVVTGLTFFAASLGLSVYATFPPSPLPLYSLSYVGEGVEQRVPRDLEVEIVKLEKGEVLGTPFEKCSIRFKGRMREVGRVSYPGPVYKAPQVLAIYSHGGRESAEDCPNNSTILLGAHHFDTATLDFEKLVAEEALKREIVTSILDKLPR